MKIKDGSSARTDHFLVMSPKLGILLYTFIYELCQLGIKEDDIIITSFVRPPQSWDSGIHATGRAIDISCVGIPYVIGKQVMDKINRVFVYDYKRPQLQSIVYHKVDGADDAEFHYHLQVH